MKRKHSPQRFRKHSATNLADHDPRSTLLRNLSVLVNRERFDEALAQVDQQVANNPETDFKSKLLSLAGDCLFRQGKFDEAATVYAQVFQQVQDRPQAWLRPAMGEIQSLLNNVQVAEATARANAALQVAAAHEQQYRDAVAAASAILAAGGQAVIPPQPPRVSVVATRLGGFFFHAGELAPAKALFQQALQSNPNGACKARIALAEIALREGDGATAATLARQAIVLGQYHAKTLSAWNVLLAAGRKTGTNVLDTTLLNGLAQATPSVRARAVLVLARGLRNQSDSRWQQLAANWLQQAGQGNPTIAAELHKLKITNARLTNATPADQQQAAQALLNTPKLGPNEWLSAAKEIVRCALVQNQSPAIDSLITQAVNRFGQTKRAAIKHGLALACKKASRADLAVQLFQQNIAATAGSDLGKSLWALAKLQSEQGNHPDAATSFWNYSQNTSMPQRFRLYALVQWVREMASANQPGVIAQARPQIEAALPQISNWELVLDLANQIRTYAIDRSFGLQVFQQGQQRALQTFDNCGHPSPAATILFKLCRRANDFALYDAMIATWTRLNDAKRQWLWSEREDYWNWIETVFRAYRDSKRTQEAEQFIAAFINDSATPPNGYAMLGVSYAAMKRNQNDFAAMFSIYEKMAQVAPTHEWTSAAYYWFALRAWKQGNASQAAAFADKMLLCIGKNWTMYWKRDMAACALLLKAGLNLDQVPATSGIATDKLQANLTKLQNDLARVTL